MSQNFEYFSALCVNADAKYMLKGRDRSHAKLCSHASMSLVTPSGIMGKSTNKQLSLVYVAGHVALTSESLVDQSGRR